MPATLGYWKLRGLAQPIRFILEYIGADYTEKLYTSTDSWMEEKFNLGLDFPNLPYYIDDDMKLTQSCAILRYIAEKANMAGNTLEERTKINMLESEAMEVRLKFAMLCYNPDFENLKAAYINETLPMKLQQLSKYLGERKWFVGDKVSFIDFLIYEAVYVNTKLAPSCLENFGNLKQFMRRIESLPAIQKYMASDRYIEYPINGVTAYFGGK